MKITEPLITAKITFTGLPFVYYPIKRTTAEEENIDFGNCIDIVLLISGF